MDIEQIDPADVARRLRAGAVLIDVREPHERAGGQAEGAQGIAVAHLVANPAAHLPALDTQVLLICQSGQRSLQAAQLLAAAGYARVSSVAGGTTRWRALGLPTVVPMLDTDERDFLERYSRQLRLPQIGSAGQKRLEAARVLVVGAGGLGSPSAYYLAAAGVGHVRIVDADTVDRSNLHRQILHDDARVGRPKVASAAQTLSALNPRVRIEPVGEMVDSANVDALLQGVDVVLDGSDNFPARYLLNDACVKHGLPLVYGAVQGFEGQASVFDAGRQRGLLPCYRCLFPEPPAPEFAPNCAEAGVLGVVPGLVGLIQATEVLKLLLQMGTPLSGRLLHVDALGMRFRQTRLAPDPDCRVCAPGRAFPGYIDYQRFCAGPG